MNKGIVVLAQNTTKINYIRCAETLAKSIRKVMPNTDISLITNDIEYSPHFNNVIKLPHGDLAPRSKWKLINDWQVYEASPYDYTIKLEADMYLPDSIDYWWDILKHRDVVVSTTIRNYKQEVNNVRYYRQLIDNNKLPDCFNAITYFKKSTLAQNFFNLVKNIFENWDSYRDILQCKKDEEATTDWVYALACHIIGPEKTTLPEFEHMSMVHMKQMINGLLTEDWTKEMVYELLPTCLRINTVAQRYPLHYHVKSFCEELDKVYG